MMARDQSDTTSSDESEEEYLKRKHHRHDRFKIERKTASDKEVKYKIEEKKEKFKVTKHKKRKKDKGKSVDVEIRSIPSPVRKLSDETTGNNSVKASSEIETAQSDRVELDDIQNVYGPSLPPGFKKTDDNILCSAPYLTFTSPVKESQLPEISPVLPLKTSNTDDVFGPVLPPNFVPSVKEPQLSENDDLVGPVPEGFLDSSESMNIIQHQLASRAKYLKTQLAKESEKSEDDNAKRESWMLELPPEKAAIVGLGPRSFRTREGPDMSDRSAWTDTPEMKLKKEMEEKTGKGKKDDKFRTEIMKAKDKVMEEQLAGSTKSSKHRTKSLLEMHQKKLKKKLKKEKKEKNAAKPERRPFDRNIDLQVNRFDEAQRKAVYKKAQLLDTRFSSGESKYL